MNVISASRRTDLPAFHWDWFMNRVAAGRCDVANPFDSRRVRHVSLRPEDVVAIVFWTRNARPMLADIERLERAGFAFYVHYTITGYPRELEPGAPSGGEAVATLRALSDRVGPQRVIWRYDPIIFSTGTPPEYHEERFAALSRALDGAAAAACISFCDFYGKTRHGFDRLAVETGWLFEAGTKEEWAVLAGRLAAEAACRGIELRSCAEPDLDVPGVRPGSCVDASLLSQLRPDLDLALRPAPSRPGCRCVESVDIGTYDSCAYGCVYCYANRGRGQARRQQATHDAGAPMLMG